VTVTLTPIGIIYSLYNTKESCPIQGRYAEDGKGRVEVFPDYAAGLQDIEGFSHIYLLYQFDRSGSIELVRPPFLDDEPHGIFACRHPCRPNGLGISIVRLLQRKGNILEVEGIDVLNETPLLDIKPYVPRFDCFPEANEGWVADKQWRPKPPGRE
jgi:tRNA-Thr(GGU) m(6)t(6)A37 methyltransferase TsaA